MKIGVLALQGAVGEHIQMLEKAGAQAVSVKLPRELEGLDGLVMPGGESTTISKLMHQYVFMEPVRHMGQAGVPLFGTCAGLILLAGHIEGLDQAHLGLLEITVRRNAFGRQRDSFEAELDISGVAEGYKAVFIRAPSITETSPHVDVLATVADQAVMVRQGHLLGAAFHPELTEDARLHRYFVEMVRESKATPTA